MKPILIFLIVASCVTVYKLWSVKLDHDLSVIRIEANKQMAEQETVRLKLFAEAIKR